jgi:hypothetical protein
MSRTYRVDQNRDKINHRTYNTTNTTKKPLQILYIHAYARMGALRRGLAWVRLVNVLISVYLGVPHQIQI